MIGRLGSGKFPFSWGPTTVSSIEVIRALELDKKSLYRGARFWFYYRCALPYTYSALFLLFMILALTKMNTVEMNLALGSILSLIMSLSVVVSYIMIKPWRRHPSSLVLYRSFTSIMFSTTIIFEALTTNDASCQTYGAFTQFSVLAGECWLTTIALDLVYSLTNPFVSYQSNLKKYHLMVWIFTGFLTFIFYVNTGCQGQFDQGICWVSISSTNSPCLWGYFLFWIVCMYAYQIYASLYAYYRLRKGLPVTFEVRKKCAMDTFTVLSVYALYLSLLVFFFMILSSDPAPKLNSGMARFAVFYLFILSNKGSVDGIVWFMLHDFPRDRSLAATADEGSSKKGGKDVERGRKNSFDDDVDSVMNEDDVLLPSSSSAIGGSRLRKSVLHRNKELEQRVTKTFAELADLAIADLDETDLSPQVNLALRTQIVQYVTTGVRNAVFKQNINKREDDDIASIMDGVFKRRGFDPAVVPGLQVLDFLLEDEYPFKAFAPDLFKQLRQLEGIDDKKYIEILSASANERLSEGASGAFMFFCGGGEFIVKTIRDREAKVLHMMLPTYTKYIKQHPDSLLCRFLGSYSLEVYSQTFYFVVMLNCFDPTAFINDRFDIKGSWVGRSAEPAKKSKKVVCRHCNEYFIPSKGESCKAVVGKHEAAVVFKDNDLRTKISLPPEQARKVLYILTRDSELLGKLGVLDYSLLVGVKKWKFDVDITPEMVAFKPPSSKDSKPGKEASKTAVDFDHYGPVSTFSARTVTGPAVYHFGVIDFLQNWTVGKQMERAFKIYVRLKDPDGLSVMPPLQYKERFQAKLRQIFDLEGLAGGIGTIIIEAPLPPPQADDEEGDGGGVQLLRVLQQEPTLQRPPVAVSDHRIKATVAEFEDGFDD